MKLKLTVDGRLFEVDVEVAEPDTSRQGLVPPASRGIRTPVVPPSGSGSTRATGAAPTDESKSTDETKLCRSPVSGVVVRLMAQIGQAIQTNDALLVLEAMKMETTITSPISGKIARLNAQIGDAVQAKQVLVEFE